MLGTDNTREDLANLIRPSVFRASDIRSSGAGNAADIIAEKIKSLIIAREIPSGYVFPRENIFCEQLGVSRSTLREAYKALESNGFITRTKRGTSVNDENRILTSLPLSESIGMSDFGELMEFRSMFEAELAGLAAKRATPENIANMENFVAKMKQSTDDLNKLTYYDMQFHLEIAKASGNKLLYNTMLMACDSFGKGIHDAFLCDTHANIGQALMHHESILEAIRSGKPDTAREAMRSHVRSVETIVGGE